jgi:hypothetical protein
VPQPFCLCHVRSKVHQALFILERSLAIWAEASTSYTFKSESENAPQYMRFILEFSRKIRTYKLTKRITFELMIWIWMI